MNDEQVRILLDLRESADARDAAEVAYVAAIDATRAQVALALAAGIGGTDIGKAARITRQRVWQIAQRSET